MAILVDTSVLIDHLRGHEGARAALREAIGGGERMIGSVLTKMEVLAGVRPSEADKTRRLLAVLHWVGVDEALAEDAGLLANRYLRSHPGVDPVDYVIAATAERERARLWTRNLKHFPMFPELTAPY